VQITRKFILSDGRIEVDPNTAERSTCVRLCKTAAKRQKLDAEPVECADENADTRVRRDVAIPASIGMSGRLRAESPADFLGIRNAMVMPAAEDRSAVGLL